LASRPFSNQFTLLTKRLRVCPFEPFHHNRHSTKREPRALSSLRNRHRRSESDPANRSHEIEMENLISLVNKIQRACTALGDHGENTALPTLWDSLPAIAVVGGQVTPPIPFSYSLLFSFRNESWRIVFLSLSELRKVLRLGERCRQRFLTSWIRSSSFVSLYVFLKSMLLIWNSRVRIVLQGLLRGDLWFCSFTRLTREAESTLSSYTSRGRGSPILVLFYSQSYNLQPLYSLLLLVNK